MEKVKEIACFCLTLTFLIWSVGVFFGVPDKVSDFGSDGVFINWSIAKIAENIYGFFSGTTTSLFDANIFYPYKNVLAYSDMYVLSGLVALVWSFVSHSLMMNSSFLMILGQVLTGIVLYFWLREIGKNSVSAMIATIAFMGSQIRLEYQVHMQMWSMQYMLLGIYGGWKYLQSRKLVWIVISGLALGLQGYESLLPMFFGVVIVGVLRMFDLKRFVIFLILVFGVASLSLATYWSVGRQFDYQRSIRDAANGSLSLDEVVTKFGSLGLFLAAILGAVVNYKRIDWKMGRIVLVGFLMALGPVLKYSGVTVKIWDVLPIPLPYAMAYLIPGFSAFREPSRWIWVFGLGLAAFAAVNLGRALSSQTANRTRRVIGILGCLGLVILGTQRVTLVTRLPQMGDGGGVYDWLKNQTSVDVIVEIPFGRDDTESKRMWYSLVHRKNLVGGFSGFAPPERVGQLTSINENGLSDESIQYLRGIGTDVVVVHLEECNLQKSDCSWVFDKLGDKIVWKDEKTVVVGI